MRARGPAFGLALCGLLVPLTACRADSSSDVAVPVPSLAPKSLPAPERLTVRVVARYPHDREAFTQGLLWHDGKVYESTGLYARSTIRVSTS